jgi:4-hydroxy-4-methyl-2-oxoglutarate aldolase
VTARAVTVAGDESTGNFVPADVRAAEWPRLDPGLLAKGLGIPGLTPTASDVMDELGLPLVVGADTLAPRVAGARVVGQVVTLRYLPERRSHAHGANADAIPRLAHHVAFGICERGDVLVIEAPGTVPVSCFGGMAALEASRRGLAGVVVDGAIRDVDEIAALGLPMWSRAVTPTTGKWRLEAVQINAPVCCGGVHVVPGDLVLADVNGVCFVPVDAAERVIERTVEVATRELGYLQAGHGSPP